jgi:hypothetical protein
MNLENTFLNCLAMYDVCVKKGSVYYKRGGKYYKWRNYVEDLHSSWEFERECLEYMNERISRRLEFKRCEYIRKNIKVKRVFKEVSIDSILNGR